ncbi:hypothetical protein [Kitasatospora indigofera]|uniref:hypothetical protein n=1 Tax=Kitasatospora indigofera TaxID=67307 RepID=UPI0036C6A070
MIDVVSARVDELFESIPELGRLRQLVADDGKQSGVLAAASAAQCAVRLAIGDALLAVAPYDGRALAGDLLVDVEEVCRRVDLVVETARKYRRVAAYWRPEWREQIKELGIEVAYSTLRAATLVPKGSAGDQQQVRTTRCEVLLRLAREAAEAGRRSVSETELHLATGDVMVPHLPAQTAGPDAGSVTVTVTSLLNPEAVRAAIEADAEVARQASKALLDNPLRRVEVLSCVAAEPAYLGELAADERVRKAVQSHIRAAEREERAPDEVAMEEAVEADPEVQLARWRAEVQRRDAQAVRLLGYDPQEIAARGDDELIDAVRATAQMYREWGERLDAAVRRKGLRAV